MDETGGPSCQDGHPKKGVPRFHREVGIACVNFCDLMCYRVLYVLHDLGMNILDHT